ncbi:hypothetical protein M5K25_011632 [Dendrobium thyrsiflorum]|uniref:Transcription factor Iwr1 domain-containing protein n=1 Tax=Dendrobium thyrsiflorum TaxID=117978 RepID=A0ABD0V3N9_DENTH
MANVKMASSSAPSLERKEKPVVVRVKRKASQASLDAFWLEINERPLKKPFLDFEKLSISDHESKVSEALKKKRLLVQHVETVGPSEAIEDVLQSLLSNYGGSMDFMRKIEVRKGYFKQDKKRDQLRSLAKQEREVNTPPSRALNLAGPSFNHKFPPPLLHLLLIQLKIVLSHPTTPSCMADPEVDHDFVFDDQGQTDILGSPFFDLNLDVDDSVEGFVDRILFTLVPSIEEHIPIGHWKIVSRPSNSPPLATSSTNYTIEFCFIFENVAENAKFIDNFEDLLSFNSPGSSPDLLLHFHVNREIEHLKQEFPVLMIFIVWSGFGRFWSPNHLGFILDHGVPVKLIIKRFFIELVFVACLPCLDDGQTIQQWFTDYAKETGVEIPRETSYKDKFNEEAFNDQFNRYSMVQDKAQMVWTPETRKPRPYNKNHEHREFLFQMFNFPVNMEVQQQIRGATRRIEREQVFKVINELCILRNIFKNKTEFCKKHSSGKDNIYKDMHPSLLQVEDELSNIIDQIGTITDRSDRIELVRNARFEQIWKSRRGEIDSLRELCHLYDVVRVDAEDEKTKKKELKHISVEDNAILCNYLPLLREYIPSAAEEIESEIKAYISGEGSGSDSIAEVPTEDGYVYDLYTVEDDFTGSDKDMSSDFPSVQVKNEDEFDDMPDSEYDSEDSNAEDHPRNDYPDEESSNKEDEEVDPFGDFECPNSDYEEEEEVVIKNKKDEEESSEGEKYVQMFSDSDCSDLEDEVCPVVQVFWLLAWTVTGWLLLATGRLFAFGGYAG